MVILPQTCETYEDNNRIEMDLARFTIFRGGLLGKHHPNPSNPNKNDNVPTRTLHVLWGKLQKSQESTI